ncbi:MAG TPA: hypothetical protein VHD57_01260 [Vicinamibacterales bacterium]|nr:hypothetical protein [Vicinamibacterales bacterium]
MPPASPPAGIRRTATNGRQHIGSTRVYRPKPRPSSIARGRVGRSRNNLGAHPLCGRTYDCAQAAVDRLGDVAPSSAGEIQSFVRSIQDRRSIARHEIARLGEIGAGNGWNAIRPIARDTARRLLSVESRDGMSVVRLIGFTTMSCGCVSGRYREVGSLRETTYIEEKGVGCAVAGHQRNQPVGAGRVAHGFESARVGKAS